MNRILLFCACCALWGCRTLPEASSEAIALSASTSEPSKTEALTAGDDVAVWARLDGTEQYFLEAAQYTVGSDGRSLTSGTPVSYPDSKQAVRFSAYFPYHTGVFSVPTDQSTASALKQADLCWATASSTPVSTPVPLEFKHLLARLIVTTNAPTTKIAGTVVPSGSLNVATGELTLNSTQSEVFTTSNELIIPAQPLNRLILTANGVEYVYEGSINLQSGQTTSLHLTLYPHTKTATLSGSSVTEWVASTTQGIPEQAVSNVLTLHWANYLPQGDTPDQIVLTIGGVDYTVSSGITYADQTFTVPFASTALRYPYTISKITFFRGATQVLPSCTQLLGATVYKSAASTVGIKDPANAIKVGNLWWATGNLVADDPNGCRIGAPADYGLYFQFGSLVGWSGGANGDGTGQGKPATIWVVVQPKNCSHPGTILAYDANNITTLSYFYFNYSVSPWDSGTTMSDIGTFSALAYGGTGTLRSGRYATLGVGDPCAYYLGENWRTPNADIMVKMRRSLSLAQPLAGSIGNGVATNIRVQVSEYCYFSNSSFYSATSQWWLHPDSYWYAGGQKRNLATPVRCIAES